MESEFSQLGKKLDGLIRKSRGTEAKVREKYAGQIKTLKAKQAAAKSALTRLKRQGSAAGGPLKAGLRKAWRDLESAVRQATKRFRETP
jgi:isocitrate dehydrogenase